MQINTIGKNFRMLEKTLHLKKFVIALCPNINIIGLTMKPSCTLNELNKKTGSVEPVFFNIY